MKSLHFLLPALLLGLFFTAGAQTSGMTKKVAVAVTSPMVTETFQVLGNCDMCKKTIEKAAASAGTTSADWDADKDLLTVTFDPAKTSVDAIQKAVALSGYDNIGYKAPDAAYGKLHACCHYDRSDAPASAKSCDKQEEN